MFKKIILLSLFVLFGIGLFGCATQQTPHNTPHVFGKAKVMSGRESLACRMPSTTNASRNSQATRTGLSQGNIS